jgi:hypothetical protein
LRRAAAWVKNNPTDRSNNNTDDWWLQGYFPGGDRDRRDALLHPESLRAQNNTMCRQGNFTILWRLETVLGQETAVP